MPQKKYVVELTERQCSVLNDACELYFRLGMGQFMELASTFVFPHFSLEKQREAEEHLRASRAVLLPELGEGGGNNFFSISSQQLPESCKIACDIRDVVRHRLAHDRLKPGEKPGWNVDFNTPQRYSKEPVVVIRRLEDKS